jgi:pimeloyl-ACP methyl ester carboxylesterase
MKIDTFLGLSEEGFHRIAYTEWGQASPTTPPIICVHGLTRLGRDFDALADYFSRQGRHLYCPDIVGRGDSDWLKNPSHYTYEQYIADMTTLIARTQAKRVDWIGTSMGGLIGMFLASLPSTPLRLLVLNDIGPQIPIKGLTRLAKYAGHDPSFASMDEAKRYFKSIYADFGPLTDAQWQHLTETSVREVTPGKFMTKLDQSVKLTNVKSKLMWKLLLSPHKALEGTFFDIDLWAVWHKITCPVLVIHGQESDILSPETIKKMQQTHANVEVITIPNTGHAPALQDVATQETIYQWMMKQS